jgi:CBS domain-containing protein
LGALDRLFEADEVRRRTLLTVIEDEALLEVAIAEAERAVGSFDLPNTGLLMVLPVTQARGLHKLAARTPHEAPDRAAQAGWLAQRDRLVQDVVALTHWEPIIVSGETTLEEIAVAIRAHRDVHLACVVNPDGRLIGVLPLRALIDDLFFHIMPEEFLSDALDAERVADYARRSRMRSAADAMQEPVWVKASDTIKDAFKRIHERKLPGLPVVDDRYHVIGYISMLDLLAIWTDSAAAAHAAQAQP